MESIIDKLFRAFICCTVGGNRYIFNRSKLQIPFAGCQLKKQQARKFNKIIIKYINHPICL